LRRQVRQKRLKRGEKDSRVDERSWLLNEGEVESELEKGGTKRNREDKIYLDRKNIEQCVSRKKEPDSRV